MNKKKILHSDANNFFASVETVLNPQLKGKPIAVCGSVEDRHGIVLAKSEIAKKAGITTGMVIHKAKMLCPDLITVAPNYGYYEFFSEKLREIYRRYTGFVEPFGLDECWLDVTASHRPAYDIAEEIRNVVKEELGLTVSIGVSFNKIYAKLGSDLKKPDAVTEITEENYKGKIFGLPCSDLLFCGRSTTTKLNRYGIFTIGDVATSSKDFLGRILGKNGKTLWDYANGIEGESVLSEDSLVTAKSIGHGVTCNSDLKNDTEVWKVMLIMAQDLGRRLRESRLKARGVHVTVKDGNLKNHSIQGKLEHSTQASFILAKKGISLFKSCYDWSCDVRAVTITAIDLEEEGLPWQTGMFDNYKKIEKIEKIDKTTDKIREKYGYEAIKTASLIGENKIPKKAEQKAVITLPGGRKR